MAIKPNVSYPGQIDTTDAAYPYGKAQNITTPGDGTGTPWEQLVINDVFGFQQALLALAGIVPSGSPDKVGTSDYMDALAVLFEPVFPKNSAFNLDFGLAPADIIEIGTLLVASRILETNGAGKAISVVKATAHNKAFGTGAGDVCEGNDARLAGLASGLKTSDLLYIEDQKSSSTAAQSVSSGSWVTRDLITKVVDNITGTTLAANVITLPAGDYYVEATAPMDGSGTSNNHKCKIRDVTNNVDLGIGTSAEVDTDGIGNHANESHVKAFFTLAGVTDIELQHRCTSTQNGGAPASFSVVEVYSTIAIWKVG